MLGSSYCGRVYLCSGVPSGHIEQTSVVLQVTSSSGSAAGTSDQPLEPPEGLAEGNGHSSHRGRAGRAAPIPITCTGTRAIRHPP